MDISQLVNIVHSLGVGVQEKNPVCLGFLNLLEETNYKIQSTMQKIQTHGMEMSVEEIQAYERYIGALTARLIQENKAAVFYLLKTIESELQDKKRLARKQIDCSGDITTAQIKHICRLIRVELLGNQDLLSTCQEFWSTLYKMMKYEDFFRKQKL